MDSLASKMHANVDLQSSFMQRVSPCQLLVFWTRQCRGFWNFQFRPCIVDGLFELCVLTVNEVQTSQPPGIIELRFFTRRIFAFPSAYSSLTYLSRFQAINDLAWMLPAVSSISPRTTCILLEAFLSILWIVWNLSKDLTSLETHRYSNNHRCGSLALHPRSCELPWCRQYISVE